ncbi:MAG: hypothetical protein Q4F24_08220 [Eubacteriales bacterium]|nr:hypothetical protein [Eubacteriales bacterium]
MPGLIDITGRTYGRLKVLKKDESKKGKRIFWICECQCGTIVSVRGDFLKNGNTSSCGCLNAENIHKKRRNSIDISEKRFGLLTAKYYVKSGKYGAIWHCECDCGGSIDTYVSSLTSGNAKSCGCLDKQNREEQHRKLHDMMIADTNISLIKKTNPNKNTTTGIRGVSWCTSKQRYIASIKFQKKQYYLCSSSDIEVCKKAREEAEKQVFGNFLEWYEEYKKTHKCADSEGNDAEK